MHILILCRKYYVQYYPIQLFISNDDKLLVVKCVKTIKNTFNYSIIVCTHKNIRYSIQIIFDNYQFLFLIKNPFDI